MAACLLMGLWGGVAAVEPPRVLPGSRFEQGGLVFAQVAPGSSVRVAGRPVQLDDQGRFVFGFHRDDPDEVAIRVTGPEGRSEVYRYPVAQRQYDIQRIDGLPQGMVTPPAPVLERIRREAEQVREARTVDRPSGLLEAAGGGGFQWPVKGPISSVYGSQRILNGEPRQPHYGLDIAVATGTPVRATADGVVRLADDDLYFTGGTIIIDHGFGVSSTYLHLSEVAVRQGQAVSQGERIGAVGATGRVTGAHLCLRYNWFDKRLDPALLLPDEQAQHP